MKRLFLILGTVAVVLPWLAGGRAQADMIHNIQWAATAWVGPADAGPGGSGYVFAQPIGNFSPARIDMNPGEVLTAQILER